LLTNSLEPDYGFGRVPGGVEVPLSDMFGDGDELVVYHFMFGRD
jgi:predicted dithiol-disulfide oxidoreductase (DUF899 family)